MQSLFPEPVVQAELASVPGLQYLLEFVTEADEQTLIESIDSSPWDTQWQRRRQPYGAVYGKRGPVQPIPDWGLKLANRLLASGVTTQPFDQMLVNEYQPGQGIALHKDYEPYGRTVASLSLLSPCVMDFRHRSTGRREHALLERRSLLVLSDEARYDWEHGIAPRKKDVWDGIRFRRGRRVSITFRFVTRT